MVKGNHQVGELVLIFSFRSDRKKVTGGEALGGIEQTIQSRNNMAINMGGDENREKQENKNKNVVDPSSPFGHNRDLLALLVGYIQGEFQHAGPIGS